MKKQTLPVNVTAGNADVHARLRALDVSQRSAVLATDGGGRPYVSLVSFALTLDGLSLLFATSKETAKYRNILANPRVSLLIDNRTNAASDLLYAEAITLIGTAIPVRRGKRYDTLAGILTAKHPGLVTFVAAKTTALVLVEVTRAVHVGGFQEVSVWEPGS